MNKVLIVLAILVLGVAGYFVLSQRNKVDPSSASLTTTSGRGVDTESGSSKMDSLRNLLTSGVSQTCTFTSTVENYQSGGTVHFSAGKMRGDFDTTADGKVLKSHMIIMDNTGYIWNDGESQGYKMVMTEADVANADKTANSMKEKGVDLDANLDYDCRPAVITEANFTLPTGVNFVSLTDMMQALSANCSVCDSLTGEAQSQCKIALKCE